MKESEKMKDPRIQTLAYNLINYSVGLKPGEKILIETTGWELPLTKELIKESYRAGGMPFVSIKNQEINRTLLENASREQMELLAEWETPRMEAMDALR